MRKTQGFSILELLIVVSVLAIVAGASMILIGPALKARAVLDRNGQPTGEYRYDGAIVNRALELMGTEIGMFTKRSEVRHGSLDPLE